MSVRDGSGRNETDGQVLVTVRTSRRKREQLNAIADARRERDTFGWGVNVVLRRAIDAYIRRHRDLLPDELRD